MHFSNEETSIAEVPKFPYLMH